MVLALSLATAAHAAPLSASYTVLPDPDPEIGFFYGRREAAIGDINGDGYADVGIGTQGALGAPSRTYIAYGVPGGVGPVQEVVSPNSAPDDYFAAVGGGGDLNGDGYDDLVVGAFGEAVDLGGGASAPYAGAVYVMYGSAGGPTAPVRIVAPDVAVQTYGAEFGFSVTIPGDLDQDGFDDLVVGAVQTDGIAEGVGAVYVFPGGAAGVRTDAVIEYQPEVLYLAHFGWQCEGGDLEGDGVTDLVALSPFGYRYFVYSSVWAGTELVNVVGDYIQDFGLGDLDGDGADEVVSLRDHHYYPETTYTLDIVGSFVGSTSVTTEFPLPSATAMDVVGDLDGDGYDDVVVGSSGATVDLQPAAGSVAVYYGGPSGLEAYTRTEFSAPPGYVATKAWFGDFISDAGDVNNDGFADFLVGESSYGAVFVYRGGCDDLDGDGFCGRDCDDDDPAAFPGAAASESTTSCLRDADGDGWGDDQGQFPVGAGTDCDDSVAAVSPGAAEVVANGRDEDCDGFELCYADADHDGHADASGATVLSTDLDCRDLGEAGPADPRDDCDDHDATRFPGAVEGLADGVDQDCDGAELCLADPDDDGYLAGTGATVSSANLACDGPGEGTLADPAGDCDDVDGAVHPGATEGVGDGVDQDCDGAELCFVDADLDGYPDPQLTVASTDLACGGAGEAPAGLAPDCDDADPSAHPGADDVPGDGVDQDCDGADASTDPTNPTEPGTGSGAGTETADGGAGPKASGGCGCDSGSFGSGAAGLVLVAILAGRRRRGPGLPNGR